MKTGNPIDGMYLFLFIIPLLVSLWSGDFLRKKIVTNLMLQSNCNHFISSFAGVFVESVILFIGIVTGLLLIKLF
jgi:hypothetical protein